MRELQPPGLEHRITTIPPLRGYGELLRPLASLLPLLALLSLLAGLALRALEQEPDPAGLMGVLGMLCWLLGLALADPLQHILLRLDRHRKQPVRLLATRIRLLLVTLMAATALSLAMLPVHFAYDQAQDLFLVQTLDNPTLVFRSGYIMLLLHIVAAPAFLLASAGLLRLLRRYLPAQPAFLLWLGGGVMLALVPASLNYLSTVPLSLGQFSSWFLEFMYVNKKLASPYIQHLLQPFIVRLLSVWGVGIFLLWISMLQPALPWRMVRPLWLACSAALLAAGLRSLALTRRWTGEVLPLSPVDWWSVLTCGMLALWLVWLILVASGERERLLHSLRRDASWLLLLPAGLLALTIPCLQAGDASHYTMLAGLLLMLPVLLLGVLLPLQASTVRTGWLRLVLLLLLALLFLLPLPQESLSLAMLRSMRSGFSLPLPEPEQLRVWLCLLAILPLAWPGTADRLGALLAAGRRRGRPARS